MSNRLNTFLAAMLIVPAIAGSAAAQQAASPLTQQHFDALDTDQDKTVSKAEYDAFMARSFSQLDRNGNGSLSQGEVGDVVTAEQFTTMDTDGDGRVTRAEFMSQVSGDFALSDRDRSGTLD